MRAWLGIVRGLRVPSGFSRTIAMWLPSQTRWNPRRLQRFDDNVDWRIHLPFHLSAAPVFPACHHSLIPIIDAACPSGKLTPAVAEDGWGVGHPMARSRACKLLRLNSLRIEAGRAPLSPHTAAHPAALQADGQRSPDRGAAAPGSWPYTTGVSPQRLRWVRSGDMRSSLAAFRSSAARSNHSRVRAFIEHPPPTRRLPRQLIIQIKEPSAH
jgi:hypothetical protein